MDVPRPTPTQPGLVPSPSESGGPLVFKHLNQLDLQSKADTIKFVTQMLLAHPTYSAVPETFLKHEATEFMSRYQGPEDLGLVALWYGQIFGLGLARHHRKDTATSRTNFLSTVQEQLHQQIAARETGLAVKHNLSTNPGLLIRAFRRHI
jgi:hypothetical protein